MQLGSAFRFPYRLIHGMGSFSGSLMRQPVYAEWGADQGAAGHRSILRPKGISEQAFFISYHAGAISRKSVPFDLRRFREKQACSSKINGQNALPSRRAAQKGGGRSDVKEETCGWPCECAILGQKIWLSSWGTPWSKRHATDYHRITMTSLTEGA